MPLRPGEEVNCEEFDVSDPDLIEELERIEGLEEVVIDLPSDALRDLRYPSMSLRAPIALPERERVRLGARLEEGDLKRALADGPNLADELVHAAVLQHAISLLVDVHAV